jgi:anti-sigma factor RsiW
MECECCNGLLSAFLDSHLTRREEDRVRAHLTRCRRCSEDLREFEMVRALLHAAPSPEVPAFLVENSMRAVRTHKSRGPRVNRFLRPEYGAGVVAVCLALVVFFGRTVHEGSGTGSPQNPHRSERVTAAALVSLHAMTRASSPLSDTGKLRYAIIEGNAQDYSDNAGLDIH